MTSAQYQLIQLQQTLASYDEAINMMERLLEQLSAIALLVDGGTGALEAKW